MEVIIEETDVSDDMITALLLQEDNGKVTPTVTDVSEAELPDGDVTVAVEYSTLNYKDGMVLKGIGRLVRDYPHVPGVDFAGVVESSASNKFKPGDRVVLNGWRVGETHWGGYATKARVSADWLVSLPSDISTEQAMAIGTAGYTAMLSVMALEDHGLTPGSGGEVLVTGAAGGVGSVAVSLLAELGYNVVAGTGREDTHAYLEGLGAKSVVSRTDLEEPARGPLGRERWAGAIDAVGGVILVNLLAALESGGSCAAVGLAAGHQFNGSVMPFLLRGVNLLGIDSVMCPLDRRQVAWKRLSQELPKKKLAETAQLVPMTEIAGYAGKILEGQVKGRIVVDVHK